MSHRVGLRLKFRSRQPIHLLQRHSSNQVHLSVCTVIRVCRRGSVLVNHLSSHPIEQCHEAGWTLECNSSISILQELAQLHVFFFFYISALYGIQICHQSLFQEIKAISLKYLSRCTFWFCVSQSIQRRLEEIEVTYKDLEDKGVTLERTLRGEAGKIRSSFFIHI